jgi:hypothetical protein
MAWRDREAASRTRKPSLLREFFEGWRTSAEARGAHPGTGPSAPERDLRAACVRASGQVKIVSRAFTTDPLPGRSRSAIVLSCESARTMQVPSDDHVRRRSECLWSARDRWREGDIPGRSRGRIEHLAGAVVGTSSTGTSSLLPSSRARSTVTPAPPSNFCTRTGYRCDLANSVPEGARSKHRGGVYPLRYRLWNAGKRKTGAECWVLRAGLKQD